MNPNVRRYGIILLFLLIAISIMILYPTNSVFDFRFDFYCINSVSSGLFLFFGASFLQRSGRKSKAVKILKFTGIVMFFIELLRVVGPRFFGYDLVIFSFVLTTQIYFLLFFIIPIAISLILIGIRNRDFYGNYLISGGILYLIARFSYSFGWGGTDYFDARNINFLAKIGSAAALNLTVITIMTSLYSLYFMFFGMRTKNNFFIVWSLYVIVNQYLTFYLFVATDILTGFRLTVLIIPLIIGMMISLKFFEFGKRFRKGLRVFISHSVDDFKRYRVEEIAKYLESQKGIGRVFYCETDLVGNIDEWMHKVVPRSNLLLFISSEESVVSQDCKTELTLAESNNLQVIPVLGFGLVWDDLKDLNLNRELGTSFDPMEFEKFCEELCELIIKHKEAVEAEIPLVKKKRKLRRKKTE